MFYHNEQQKLAENYKKGLKNSHTLLVPIVTEIVPFQEFYEA